MHAAGQHFKKNYGLPYIVLVSEPEHKANRLAVAERNLMEFLKPAVSCPIECNCLLVCVQISCGFGERRVRALQRADCPHAPGCGLPARFDNRLALSPHASSSPARQRELLQEHCSCLSLRRRPPPAAAATVPGTAACSVQQRSWWPAAVACAVQHSLTVTGTDSRDDSDGRFLTVLSILCRSWPTDQHSKESHMIMSGNIGLGRHFWHTINQYILVRFQQTRVSLAQWSISGLGYS